jgi:ketosteroid isomerase-like protein
MTPDLEVDREAVKKVVRRWARTFSSKDLEGVLATWDRTYPHIIYQAEEFPDPLRGWSEVEHYYRTFLPLISNLRDQSIIDFEVDVLGDVAWCYMRGTITFDIAGSTTSVSGEVRQLFLFRRTSGGWKIIQYHDSRETPGLRQPFLPSHPRARSLQLGRDAR